MKKSIIYAEMQNGGGVKTTIDANGGEIMEILAAINAAVAVTMLQHGIPAPLVTERIHRIADSGLTAAKGGAK